MKKAYIDCGITQTRSALFENGKLIDLFIENSDDINISGNIYKGRVENIVSGLNAAFINIGSDKNAMLHFDTKEDIDKIKRGSELLVQVIREPSRDKGARVTLSLSLTGKYVVLVPNDTGINISRKIVSEEIKNKIISEISEILEAGSGIIIRTEAAEVDISEVKKELILLKNIWTDIQEHSTYIKAPNVVYTFRNQYDYLMREFIKNDVDKIYINREENINYIKKASEIYSIKADIIYDKKNFIPFENIEREIESLFERKKGLPSGGFIFVEKTEAMVVFDVNSGSFTNTNNKNETILKTNIEASCEIARIIRLCNFSGIIIIDFIDMTSEKDYELLIDNLKKEFAKDRMPVKLFGFTKLGLMEISRPRKGKTIYEALYRDYYLKELNYSYMLKVIENRCLKEFARKSTDKFTLNVQPAILVENEELLKYFKKEMLGKYDIVINYNYPDNASGIDFSLL